MKKIHYVIVLLAVVLTGCWSDYEVETEPLKVASVNVYGAGDNLYACVALVNQTQLEIRLRSLEMSIEQGKNTLSVQSTSEGMPLIKGKDTLNYMYLLTNYSFDPEQSFRITELYAKGAYDYYSPNLLAKIDPTKLFFTPSSVQEIPISASLSFDTYSPCWSIKIQTPMTYVTLKRVYIYYKKQTSTQFSTLSADESSGKLDVSAGVYEIYAEAVVSLSGRQTSIDEYISVSTPHYTVQF